MTIESAMRLARLVSEYRKGTRHLASLERRILALLAASAPADTALRDTTLAALQDALAQLCRNAGVKLSPASVSDSGLIPNDES